MMSKTQGLQEGDSSSVQRKQVNPKVRGQKCENMDKLWPGHGQNRPKQSNCERCRQEDWTDNKGPKTLRPGRGRHLQQKRWKHWKCFTQQPEKEKKKKRSSSSSNDFVLVMLSKKRRRFGVHPPHLLIEGFKMHCSWFQMYFRMLVGHVETLFQMLALTVAVSTMSLLTPDVSFWTTVMIGWCLSQLENSENLNLSQVPFGSSVIFTICVKNAHAHSAVWTTLMKATSHNTPEFPHTFTPFSSFHAP